MVLGAMSGFDTRDSTSVDTPVPDYVATLDAPLAGLKIGLIKEFFDKGLDANVEKLIREALKVYEKLGAKLVEVKLPALPLSVPTYYVVAPAECSSNLARFDGVRYGYRCKDPKDLLDLYKRSRGEGFGAEVKRRIMVGTYVLVGGVLRRLLPQGAARAAAHQPGLQARLRRSRRVDRADGARRRLRDWREDRGSHPDVSQRHLHDRRESRRRACHIDSVRVRARTCRWACRSRARTSPRRNCSTWRTCFRRKPTGIGRCRLRSSRRSCHDLGDRHRTRGPRAALDEVEDFLRLADGLWQRSEYAGESRRPGVSGRAARAEPGSGAHGGEVRPRHRRRGCAAFGVRAQELLLSGSAQGLPDQPVRAAHRRERASRHRARRRREEAHRHHARAPRRGRGQVAARRIAEAVRHRSEPRRHAAHRDRLRARSCARRRRPWPT